MNRAEDGKLGGGISVLFKSNGSLSVWDGVEENAERLWVTYENGEEKHAFCGVYLVVKPYKGKKAEDLNAEISNLSYYILQQQNWPVHKCISQPP